jgi:hypothetical protein
MAPAMAASQSMHRTASYADYTHGVDSYEVQQYMQQRHNMANSVHEFHPAAMAEQPQTIHVGQRANPCYVTDSSNPGIATMNTNTLQHVFHNQIPRTHVQRPHLEIPYSAPGLNASIQSSPSAFSAASGRSPTLPDGFYSHQAVQAASYNLQATAASPDHAQPMMQYHQMATAATQQQHAHHVVPRSSPAVTAMPTANYAQASPHQEAQNTPWYQYQSPIEVVTIGQLPAFGTGMYDLFDGPKIEFEDPTMPLPSSNRIETL